MSRDYVPEVQCPGCGRYVPALVVVRADPFGSIERCPACARGIAQHPPTVVAVKS